MDNTIKSMLVEAGIDIDEALARMAGKYELIERFLKRFPQDENFARLKKGLEDNNCQEAFRAAHTLKGVCANLSMNRLKELVSTQVEYLREENLVSAKELMPEVSRAYEKMVEDLTRIYG